MSASLRPARSEPPYDAVVFDCDSTLSWIEGIEDLQDDRAGVRDEVARLTAQAMAGEIPLEAAYGRRLELIAPTLGEVEAVGKRYVETLMEGAADVVRGLRLLGKDVGIVSGGLLPPVRTLGRHLGVPDDRIFAVGIEFDGDGAYAGFDAASPLARAGGKPEVVTQHFGGGSAALIGDGATDLEAASACARFVAFAGVVERARVVGGADRAVFAPDLAAILPHVLTAKELNELRSFGDPALAQLVDRAHRPRLWIPGPTEVRGDLLRRQSLPMIGHRTSEAKDLIRAVNAPLRRAFGLEGATRHEVAVHSCTATGLMEMSLRALGSVDAKERPRVLSLVNGAFSERYAAIAESVGCEVVRIESEAGCPADLDAAADALASAQRSGQSFKAVTVTLSETSTGALTEPSEIAAALSRRGPAMLLADAVTYLGAAPLDMARHGMDFAFAGTQKALALPPGLGLYGVSHRFLKVAREAESRGFFLDLVRITEAHLGASPPMTPTLPLLRALLAQLEAIEAGEWEERLSGEPAGSRSGDGWPKRFARHARMRSMAAQWLAEVGGRWAGVERPGGAGPVASSPSVTCIGTGGRSVENVLAQMRTQGFEIAAGYGDLKATHVRLGHMGDHSVTEFRALLRALSGILLGS